MNDTYSSTDDSPEHESDDGNQTINVSKVLQRFDTDNLLHGTKPGSQDSAVGRLEIDETMPLPLQSTP